ncbi:MAG: hypothetical protein ACJ8G3_01145 [Burkholderiaceae bacterium]
MLKTLIVGACATLIAGGAFAAAHTAAPSTPTTQSEKKNEAAKENASKDATGKTQANREGKMSPTGQNETSSTTTKKEGAGGTTGTMSK